MITLKPAYGRRYDNVREMLSDWNAGKDFFSQATRYVSIRDFEALKGETDKIEVVWLSKDATKPMHHTLWIHPLAQVVATSYISNYPGKL